MRTRIKALVSMIVGALFLGITPGVSTAAAQQFGCSLWDERYTYFSVLRREFQKPTATDKKVIGIDRGLKTDRAKAIIADYHDDPNQRWHTRSCKIDDRGFIFDQHKNWKSKKCLDKSEDAPNGNGNVIYQYTCGDTYADAKNQLWLRQNGGHSVEGWQQQRNFAGQGCIDIKNEQYANGAELVQWDCAPNAWDTESHTQQWNTYR